MQSSKPKQFQYYLAIFGSFAFLINFQIASWVLDYGYLYFSQLLIGYNLGFLLSFSLLVFLEILRGNSYRFIDSNAIFKPISYMSLVTIFIFSVVGVWSTNFHTISYGYNATFFIGSIISGFGLVPVISFHDE